MTKRFFDVAFTPSVRKAQEENGSADAYGRLMEGESHPDQLTEQEAYFIMQRDSFYMASVSQTGWPYMQHRGGPKGFIKVLSPTTFGIADFRGNRQYVSLGNINADDRVSLFFMDYPGRQRLKVFAHARSVSLEEDPETIGKLTDPEYGAKIERGLLFDVEAYDWNCPQHITPRFTEEEATARFGG